MKKWKWFDTLGSIFVAFIVALLIFVIATVVNYE